MTEIRSLLKKIISGISLSETESESLFTKIMDGNLSNIQTSSILTALSMKGEEISEIVGATKVLRAKSLSINAPLDSIDTCGTGGDNSGTGLTYSPRGQITLGLKESDTNNSSNSF